MQHLKDQNWFAVGLDMLVVIVGIFLGMQVTEWNEHRKDREDEVEFVNRLHEDLLLVQETSSRVLERRIGTFHDLSDAVKILFDKDSGAQLTKAQCDAIGNSDILNIVIAELPSLAELQASGRLEIISNREIRTSAVVLQQRITVVKELIDGMTRANIPLLIDYPELVQVTSVFNKEMNEFNLSTKCNLELMREHEGFLNSVSTNLDVYDAYLRDGIYPWRKTFTDLIQLTETFTEKNKD